MIRQQPVSRWTRPLGVVAFLTLLSPAAARADDWPQWLGPHRDGVWREHGILKHFPKEGPKVLWRTPIRGGYTGPAVAGGRVYVMDRPWPKNATLTDAARSKDEVPKTERILCLDAAAGKLLWKHEYPCRYAISYPAGPRTTPLVHAGKVYTLGAMGHLHCLDAANGKVLWSKDLQKEYKVKPPVWGWSASLLLDGNKLISLVGGKDHAVVAFDRDSGKELWHALTTEEVCYVPPVIFKAGGKRQLIIWHGGSVNSLDPETGRKYWSQPYPVKGEVQRPEPYIMTPRKEGDLLFVSSFYHGPLMLKLAADRPAAMVLWSSKSNNPSKPDGLHAVNCTPVFRDGHIYGVGGLGELCCLKADTGKLLWQTQAATGKKGLCATAFLIPHGDRFFVFNDQGDLIIARLSPQGYKEDGRAHLLEPTQLARGRMVVWSHPAFANRCLYARNDKEIICVALAGT
jgi:outer membrane protein assembly factor BamB